MTERRTPVLHSFMVMSLFVLVCYREVQPFVKWEELMGIWLAVLLVTFVVFWAARHVVTEPYKASLLTTIILGAVCFYGDYDSRLRTILGQQSEWARTRILAAAYLLVVALLVAALLQTRRSLLRLKRLLNVAISAMVVATVVKDQLYPIHFVSRRDRPRENDEQGTLSRTNGRPDIYYLVFDSYTSAESLRQFWNYDNSAFTSFLTNKGFRVVADAHGNYDHTYRCMAASLNMTLLPPPPPGLSTFGRVNRACEMIDLAAVPRKLEEIGYNVVNLSLFDVAGREQFYEVPQIDYSSLTDVMLRKSLFGYVEAWYRRIHLKQVHERILARLHSLPTEKSPQPRFIYAHILLPHGPFLYDRHGLRPKASGAFFGTPQEYLDQLIFVNGIITNLVSDIIAHSPAPPIIVLQGDHGYRYLRPPDQSKEATTILNAYYLPGSQPDWVYPGITPVNTFRMIFNHYFAAQYKYVPDRWFLDADVLSTEPLPAAKPLPDVSSSPGAHR